jgi:hypothetical protein
LIEAEIGPGSNGRKKKDLEGDKEEITKSDTESDVVSDITTPDVKM